MPLSAGVPLLFPQTLGMKGRGVVSGLQLGGPGRGSRLSNRLWGLIVKLEVDQAVGLFPHTLPLPSMPARWSSLVGLVW